MTTEALAVISVVEAIAKRFGKKEAIAILQE